MKKILIISPHFPPSNLVGVHRARFISSHFKDFEWEPIVLAVHERHYEEPLDFHLEKLLPSDLRIEKVRAMPITKPRLIGDIGLRAFYALYKRAKQIIQSEKVDFLYITIPSFYCALLGRMLHRSTRVPYGIDYQDPWVHKFRGSGKTFSRPWFAQKVSKILEPYAVRDASLITGVSSGYYESVIKRNPHLRNQAVLGDLPIGTEPSDYEKIRTLTVAPYLFKKEPGKVKLVYAGTMLPKAYAPFEVVCKILKNRPEIFQHVEIHFIGSGSKTDDPGAYNVRPIAEKYGLWQSQIFEYPARIPYLDVLVHLNEADGIFILGSTEVHYSPSKVYQGILSGKPIFAILHQESTAIQVIRQTCSGTVLSFNGEGDLDTILNNFHSLFTKYLTDISHFTPKPQLHEMLKPYFAKSITGKLAALLNKATAPKSEKRKMLLISPHFPPSNLTAVHRARLFSEYLPKFNWEPIILTVDEKYYEEELDQNLLQLVSPDIRIEKVNATMVRKPRIIGDIGLRGFYPMFKRARKIIRSEEIDFVYIIVPSFYGALWGRMLHHSTGVPYGVDYIDPWVHLFPGGKRILSRAWLATKLSKLLEPIAVKKASLISGVAESYYEKVLERNKHLQSIARSLTLPPAAEIKDYNAATSLDIKPYLFPAKSERFRLMFAGAMQPTAFPLLEAVFSSIANNPATFADTEFHFVGSGKSPDDRLGFNIRPLAMQYHLWEKQIFEYPARIPYLDVLAHLNVVDGVFVLGSVEPHYVPSKVFQAILSRKPIFAVLNETSPAVEVIQSTRAGVVNTFPNNGCEKPIRKTFQSEFVRYRNFAKQYNFCNVDQTPFENFMPETITRKLAEAVDSIINSQTK